MAKQTNNKIPKGYEQTEIGVIPEDWNLVSYDEAFNFLRTASYSRAQLGTNEKTHYIHYGDIHTKWNNFVDINQELPTINASKICNYSLIENGDLIMADASEDYEGIGKSVEVKNKHKVRAISGLHTFLLRDKGNFFIPGFLGYIHNNKLVKSSLDRLATGLKVYGVSKTNLKLVQIPVPPKPEQTAIANVLSDAGALIESLDKLINKKKKIKKGAMQELLTGKRRLPGFEKKKDYKQTEVGVIPKDWEVFLMGSLGNFSKGQGIKKDESLSGDIPCIRYGEIYTNHSDYVKKFYSWISPKVAKTSRKLNKGDILFAGSGETKEEIGKCVAFIDNQKAYAGGDIVILTPHKGESKFLGYLFNSPIVVSQKSSRGQGDAIVHISAAALSKISVPLPLKPEQTAIANMLSDMDVEIETLEQKLDKYKQIKQGMMQQLLTGKIRLVN